MGGCGDPDQHEQFGEIQEVCQSAGIVPNFTTSGLGLTSELAHLCKKYCGAVAASWHRSPYTLRAIDLLLQTQVLKCDDPQVREFLDLACNGRHGYKIGFDSCSIPGLISQSIDVNKDSVDTCEGARFLLDG